MRSILNHAIGKVFADNGKEKLIAEIEELLLCDFLIVHFAIRCMQRLKA